MPRSFAGHFYFKEMFQVKIIDPTNTAAMWKFSGVGSFNILSL